VDGLWATKSEFVGLIDRAISFQDLKISNLCGPDGQTTCNRNIVLCTIVHRAVIKLKRKL